MRVALSNIQPKMRELTKNTPEEFQIIRIKLNIQLKLSNDSNDKNNRYWYKYHFSSVYFFQIIQFSSLIDYVKD